MEDNNKLRGMDGLNKLVAAIIDECKEVHTNVGRGLYASVYKQMLYQGLMKKGMYVQQHVPVYAPDDQLQVQVDLKAEFVVENSVICEIKTVEAILPMHKKSLATFLRLSNLPVGLLVNFKEPNVKNGIVKMVNTSYKKVF
ncbi:MAG: GxxExxY protein [Chitinophagaceae bacterium]